METAWCAQVRATSYLFEKHPCVLGCCMVYRSGVCMQAPPGAGKTLAFLLPMASSLLEGGQGCNTKPAAPLALIISPTRELAQQIRQAAAPLQQLLGLRCACVHGGASREEQIVKLQQKPHLLVATPGRYQKIPV